MAYGFFGGRGTGRGPGGGMGFGFRGSSPPWPYVGIGRGGLPRCGYFIGGAPDAARTLPYQQFAYPSQRGFTAGSAYSPDQEIDLLKNQSDAISKQLEDIEARIRELQKEE